MIDLIAAHTFTSNSPCVNLACGKFAAKTEVTLTLIHRSEMHLILLILSCIGAGEERSLCQLGESGVQLQLREEVCVAGTIDIQTSQHR